MGFSLKRALLGAVVGGAHAAGEVYDAQLKEAAANRQRELELEKQKELESHRDQLLEAREGRKQEFLDKREKDKREIYKNVVAAESATLKEKGIGIGSAEGQQAIANAFITAGYPEFGDKFSDNAQKAREADDRKDLKKIELANAAETRRFNRETAANQRESNRLLKRSEEFKVADKAFNDFLTDYEVPTFNDNGQKTGVDPTVKNWIRSQTLDMARKNPYEAMAVAQNLGQTVDELRSANPGASLFKITQMAEERVKSGTKAANTAISGQTMDFNSPRGATAPSAPRGSQPEVRIPGMFENIGQNPGDYQQAAGA